MSVNPPMQDDHLQSGLGDERNDHTSRRSAAEASTEQQAESNEEARDHSSDAPLTTAALLAAEKDRFLRLQAEMQNLRSRTSREIADERRYGSLPLMRDLLPVLDNVQRAIEAAEKNEAHDSDTGGMLEGLMLVQQQLLTIMKQHHCVPIEATGKPFDPQFHEAILQQPSDEIPKEHVLMESQVGYRMHDRVVRASQVIVSSGPSE